MTQHGVILVDPPWSYQNWTSKANGAAAAHYDGMSYEELLELPVRRWAADDAVLLLWATWPKLYDAMGLVEGWGFTYVTGFPWVKTIPTTAEVARGVGFWTMGCSEMLLVARRGKPTRQRGEAQIGLMVGEEQREFYAPRRKHSEKPVGIHEWAEETLKGPYLELFARNARAGWTCWGLDLGVRLGAAGAELDATGEMIG